MDNWGYFTLLIKVISPPLYNCLDVPLEIRINGDPINGLVITDPYKWGKHWGV